MIAARRHARYKSLRNLIIKQSSALNNSAVKHQMGGKSESNGLAFLLLTFLPSKKIFISREELVWFILYRGVRTCTSTHCKMRLMKEKKNSHTSNKS